MTNDALHIDSTYRRVSFFVPGEPVAKGRARASIRKGKVAHHTPEKTVNYESLVALAASGAMAAKSLLDGPLAASFTATFGIPKSWSKKRLAAHAELAEWVIKRPDLDNIGKALFDGMNGVVYGDDAQIVNLCGCRKVYGATPGVQVCVWELRS